MTVASSRGTIRRRPAFLAVRALRPMAAIAVQDSGKLLEAEHTRSPLSAAAGRGVIVASTGGEPSGTCFCASMGTGPGASGGNDLALTELMDDRGHPLPGSRPEPTGGAEGRSRLAGHPPRRRADRAAGAFVDGRRGRERMGRRMETDGASKRLLQDKSGTPATGNEVGGALPELRPTAPMGLTADTLLQPASRTPADLAGETAQRERALDSCFNASTSRHLPDGPLRTSNRDATGQMDDHKAEPTGTTQFGRVWLRRLRAWHHWCPVGIEHHRGSRGDPRDGGVGEGANGRSRTFERIHPGHPSLPRPRRRDFGRFRPAAARRTCVPAGRVHCAAKGSPPDRFFLLRARPRSPMEDHGPPAPR